jgi:hypothetical protein
MKYAVEMGSAAKFHKDLFRHCKVNRGGGGIHKHTGGKDIA